MAEAMIRVRKVTKSYTRGGQTLVVLDQLGLEMEQGRFYALMGPSGSGKTTLLNVVAGIDSATSGRVNVAGSDLARLSDAELSAWRLRNVGYVFQQPTLFPHLDVRGNLDYGAKRAGSRRVAASQLIDMLGLGDLLARSPDTLSGGEAQRVADLPRRHLVVAHQPGIDRQTGSVG